MGINGVIYFILIIVALGIVVIVLLRSIAVYLMAFMAITVLIGLTPLFLSFILFERTFYLFDNWVKFMFRYMLEPVVLLAGIIILTQLFTIYLDFVIGYSVCWKCAIPLKIPFPSIQGVTPAFLDVELFCFNWFAPWGFDHRSSQMGLNMQNMIVLIMIVYCMWGYLDFSGNIVARLAGSAGGPSATGMGKGMAGAIEEKALSKVGLDSKSRAQMKAQIKERLKTMESADKKMPLDKGNRNDIKPPSGKESGKGNTSADPKSGVSVSKPNKTDSDNEGLDSGLNSTENISETTSSMSSESSSGGSSKWKAAASSGAKTVKSGIKMGAQKASKSDSAIKRSASKSGSNIDSGSSSKESSSTGGNTTGSNDTGSSSSSSSSFGNVTHSSGSKKSGVTIGGNKLKSSSIKSKSSGSRSGGIDSSKSTTGKSKVQRSSLESSAKKSGGNTGSNSEGNS